MRLLGFFSGVAAGIYFLLWGMGHQIDELSASFFLYVACFMLFLLLIEMTKKYYFVLGIFFSLVGIVGVTNISEIALPFILALIYGVFVVVDWVEHTHWYTRIQE